MILKMNRNFLIIFFLLFTMVPGAFSHATQLPYELISEFWTVLQDDDVNSSIFESIALFTQRSINFPAQAGDTYSHNC